MVTLERAFLLGILARFFRLFGCRALFILLASLGLSIPVRAAEEAPAATYVGEEICASCHGAEAKRWQDSHHALAMAHANESSVLGDFNNTSFKYFAVTTRFFRNDQKYLVETDGSDGVISTFEVKYTFGVDPLQQYLVEFPDGRIQALPFAWDSRPKDKGGQRWIHLYADDKVSAGDPLHWTKASQNWNFMCASCHSTNVHKNYDAAKNTFNTTYSEINVSCEACHGPGSGHVAWAKPGAPADPTKGLVVNFDERAASGWAHRPGMTSPVRTSAPLAMRKEVETCGPCHARAAELKEDWIPGQSLSQTHLVTPIEPQLYSADGQMVDREETYNYVPFKQSRMFAAGVTCSDCHDPHSSKLRSSPTQTCLACHDETLATPAHTHHQSGASAPDCVSCHMPSRTYMQVDVRHDHSFRIPRPDLSAGLDTPNACTDCHHDKGAVWAAKAVETWFGPNRKGFQIYGPAFHAAWTDSADAEALLNEAARLDANPAVARASALSALASYPSAATLESARKSLSDPDPMVRIGALDALETATLSQEVKLVSPLLSDPVLAVRSRAVWLLAAAEADIPASAREAFARAVDEFETAQRLNADRPEARVTLAGFHARIGRLADAQNEFAAALKLDPAFSPATIGLAQVYRQLGQDATALEVLRAAAAKGGGDLHYELGLALVRAQRYDEALAELAQATEITPRDVHFAYSYAVALNSLGQSEKAMNEIERGLALRPRDLDLLSAALAFNRDAGHYAKALTYAQQLRAIIPDSEDLTALIADLQRMLKSEKP